MRVVVTVISGVCNSDCSYECKCPINPTTNPHLVTNRTYSRESALLEPRKSITVVCILVGIQSALLRQFKFDRVARKIRPKIRLFDLSVTSERLDLRKQQQIL
jgi:hypothetical protein